MKIPMTILWVGCALLPIFLFQACSKNPWDDYRASAGAVADVTAQKPEHASVDPGYLDWCFEWSRQTHLEAYETHGRRDPAWDEVVRDALSSYARNRVTREPVSDSTRDEFKRAADAGCDDPLVVYLNLRLTSDPNNATPKIATRYTMAARELDASPYAGLIQCLAHLRAAQAWRSAHTNQPPHVNEHRGLAFDRLLRVLQQDQMPVTIAYEFCDEFYRELKRSPQSAELFRQKIEPLFMARWPEEALAFLLNGQFAIDSAWAARGGGWASTVTDKSWEVFARKLADAEEALNRSWELDPSLPGTPLEFLRLELGQGRGRARMEMWFDRAIAHPSARYEALQHKLWYLQPRWHGSEQECLDVARDVLKSDEFRGNCPLHLYHLHESLSKYFEDRRPDYWLEPHVWADIKACFERYFSFPEAHQGWRHNYVLSAYRCRQWDTLNEELAKLDSVNHDYFGGEAAFQRIKAEAQRHAQE